MTASRAGRSCALDCRVRVWIPFGIVLSRHRRRRQAGLLPPDSALAFRNRSGQARSARRNADRPTASLDRVELRRIELAVGAAELAGDADPAVVADHVGALLAAEPAQHASDALARAAAGVAHSAAARTPSRRARGTAGRAAARSTASDRPVRGPRPSRPAPWPPTQASSSAASRLERPSGASPGSRSACRRRSSDCGRNCTSSPPARQSVPLAGDVLGDRQPDQRRDLLGLAEILVRRLLEALAFERHDALVARRVRALVDGEGQMAVAEQLGRAEAGRRVAASRVGIETREGAQPVGRVEIDDEHVDGAVACASAAGTGPRSSATSRAARSAPPPRRPGAPPASG